MITKFNKWLYRQSWKMQTAVEFVVCFSIALVIVGFIYWIAT